MKRISAKLASGIAREWERTILVTMLLLGVGAMIPGAAKVAALLNAEDKRHSPKVNVDPVFAGEAFAFLEGPEGAEIARNHAFVITPPQNWRPPRPPRKPKPIRVYVPPVRTVNSVKPVKTVNTVLVKPPPPPQPIRHYLIYRGFYKREEGTTLAYITEENVQGGNKLRGRVHFLKEKGEVGKYKVKSFTADVVELEDESGRIVEIFVGDRFQSGVTTNPPDELLEHLRVPGKKGQAPKGAPDAQAPKAGKKNKKNRKNRKNKGQNEDQLRNKLKERGIDLDQLKKMGVDIDQLQKGKINPEILKNLQKRFTKD